MMTTVVDTALVLARVRDTEELSEQAAADYLTDLGYDRDFAVDVVKVMTYSFEQPSIYDNPHTIAERRGWLKLTPENLREWARDLACFGQEH